MLRIHGGNVRVGQSLEPKNIFENANFYQTIVFFRAYDDLEMIGRGREGERQM